MAAALLVVAAGCTGTTDAGGLPDSDEAGERYRTVPAAAPEGLAAAETSPGAPAWQRDDPGIESPAPPGSDCSFLDTMSDIQDSVFQLIINSDNGKGLGTAFYIGDGEFLTAAHLIDGRTNARLRNAVADFPASVIAIDDGRDVALLEAGEPPSEALRLLSSTDVRPGQSVASVGYPLFEEYRASITGGLVSRLSEDRSFGTLIQTDAPINRGNSGGPLVDQCGRVVGMIVEKWFEEGVHGVAWAIASNSLEAALTDLRKDRPPALPAAIPQTAGPTLRSVLAGSPPTGARAFLDEVAVLFEDYHDLLEEAGRYFASGEIDAVTQERILREIAEDSRHYRNALMSEGYDLGGPGRNCDLARRDYARALGWTSLLARYRAAQVWTPGKFDLQAVEAFRRSREFAAEASNHRDACTH